MSISAISSVSVDVARMFQPSTANVTRPHPSANTELILKLFDGQLHRPGKLVNNYLSDVSSPQLVFTA